MVAASPSLYRDSTYRIDVAAAGKVYRQYRGRGRPRYKQRSRPERALGKRSRGNGLSQRTGLMSTMIIGAIGVRPARESEKTMSRLEVTVKAVRNSDEVAFCSSSTGRVRRSPPH